MSIRYIGSKIDRVGEDDGTTVPFGHVEVPKIDVHVIRRFSRIMRFLNGKDRDILYLIFVSGKRQETVQKLLCRSQPSLCYDIRRIRRKLKFIFYLDETFDQFVDFVKTAKKNKFTDEDVAVLTLMFYTTGLSETARAVKRPQARVRYCFDRSIAKMRRLRLWDMYELFINIRLNPNVLRRQQTCQKGKHDIKLDTVVRV